MPTVCSACGRTSGKCESCIKVDAVLTPERVRALWNETNLTHGTGIVGFARAISREVVAIVVPPLEKDLETERMRLAACGVIALSNTRDSAAKARDVLPEYWSGSAEEVARAVDREMDLRSKMPAELLEWACIRWREEVQDRPLVNKHRRTLDDTWRQVIRFAGGDPDELVGPSHDALLATPGASGAGREG